MSAHWYLFCPASGLGFLLMEFPWLFFSHPTKMLPFSKFSLPFCPSLSRSLFRSLFFLPARSCYLSPPRSLPHKGTAPLYITPFWDAEVLLEEIWLCPGHISLPNQIWMCICFSLINLCSYWHTNLGPLWGTPVSNLNSHPVRTGLLHREGADGWGGTPTLVDWQGENLPGAESI